MMLLLLACSSPSPDDPNPKNPQVDSDASDSHSTSDSDSSPSDDSADPSAVKARVGVTGGIIEYPGGPRIEIPEGALASEVEIGIRKMEPSEVPPQPSWMTAISDAYEFTPSGTVFSADVTVTFPVQAGLSEDEDTGIGLRFWDEQRSIWRVYGPEDERESMRSDFDPSANTVTVSTTHFSVVTGTVEKLGAPQTRVSGTHQIQVQPIENCTVIERDPRSESTAGVVVHSTSGGTNFAKMACYLADRGSYDGNSATVGAHYLISRSGVIAEVFDPDLMVPHVAGTTGECGKGTALNEMLVGIELLNTNGGGGAQTYSGSQMAALSELVAYLMDRYDLTPPQEVDTRPVNVNSSATSNTWAAHTSPTLVFHSELDGCRPASTAHMDPFSEGIGIWRKDAFLSTQVPNPEGWIDVSGGDSVGTWDPGASGKLTVTVDDSLSVPSASASLEVKSGDIQALSGTLEVEDLIIDGTVTLTGDLKVRAHGSVYVSREGQILGPSMNLTIEADGLVMLTGNIDLSGGDAYEVSDARYLAGGDVNACFYQNDSTIEGIGFAGGSLTVTTHRGPLYVPTVLALGGDAHTYDPLQYDIPGGAGGPVKIDGGDYRVRFAGSAPPPATWTFATRSKTFRANQACDASYVSSNSVVQLSGATVSRGVVTSGGLGARSIYDANDATINGYGAPGGNGGTVDIQVTSSGYVEFDDVDIWTGGGTNVAYAAPYVQSLSRIAGFLVPFGGTGGNGTSGYANAGGDGGLGGDAGAVQILGSRNLDTLVRTEPLFGFSSEAAQDVYPGSSPSLTVGALKVYADGDGHPSLRVSAAGGSGGSPGGSSATFPGLFGMAGIDGAVP